MQALAVVISNSTACKRRLESARSDHGGREALRLAQFFSYALVRDRAVTETKAAGKMPALPGKIMANRNWERGRLARF